MIVSTYALKDWISWGDWGALSRGFVEIGLVTFIILLFGEVIPKVYASKNAIVLAKLMSIPLVALRRIFYPISILLVSGTSFIDRKVKKKAGDISVDDLENALEITDSTERSEDEQRICFICPSHFSSPFSCFVKLRQTWCPTCSFTHLHIKSITHIDIFPLI